MLQLLYGFPRWYRGKESACQCRNHRRCEFNPWVRKIPWRRDWLPTPVFLPGKSLGQRILMGHSTQGHKESDRTEHTCAVASSVQFSSVAPSCPTLCDPMDCSTPGLLLHHQLLELAQTHIHRVNDAIQPSHHLPSPSPPAFNLSQHQGLFKWVSSSH